MGNNSSRVTAKDETILQLKIQRDKLQQYQRRIVTLTDRETRIARALLAKGDKPRALLALRRKKYQESLLSQTDQQLEQLEKLVSSVEFALIQKDVLFGLQQGTRVLNEIHAEMGGIENVEKLMGESADAVAYQREISETLAGRLSNQGEDEVEEELAALEAEVVGKVIVKEPPASLPSVPDTRLPTTPETEPQHQQQQQQQQQNEPARERQAMLA